MSGNDGLFVAVGGGSGSLYILRSWYEYLEYLLCLIVYVVYTGLFFALFIKVLFGILYWLDAGRSRTIRIFGLLLE